MKITSEEHWKTICFQQAFKILENGHEETIEDSSEDLKDEPVPCLKNLYPLQLPSSHGTWWKLQDLKWKVV